jgi:hypothetical protein
LNEFEQETRANLSEASAQFKAARNDPNTTQTQLDTLRRQIQGFKLQTKITYLVVNYLDREHQQNQLSNGRLKFHLILKKKFCFRDRSGYSTFSSTW